MISRTFNQRWLAALLAIALIACVVIVVRFMKNATVTPEQALTLVHEKNVGLGLLENQKIPEALEIFSSIGSALPNDPLPVRNIAVARILALGSEEQPADAVQIANAEEALARMLSVEGVSNDYHWLAFRAAVAARNETQMDENLAAILQANPQDVHAWYARYRIARLLHPREPSPAAQKALQTAVELRPWNVWLQVEWLRTMGAALGRAWDELPVTEPERQQALAAISQEYANLPVLLRSAEPAVKAFSHAIRMYSRVDIIALLNEAVQKAEDRDFGAVSAKLMSLANVLAPHSQVDRQQVLIHPLDFVLTKFSPKFYSEFAIAELPTEPAIEVKLFASASQQIPSALAEKLGPVLDVAVADMDLDGFPDLIVLSDSQLVVWSQSAGKPPWRELTTVAVSGAAHIIAQDLDNDFEETTFALQQQAKASSDVPAMLASGCPTADLDLVLCGESGVQILENFYNAATQQRILRSPAGLKLPASAPVRTATCADLDADGDLDLALALPTGIQLWTNNGDWTFSDITSRSTLPDDLSSVRQWLAIDWDRDADVDLLLVSSTTAGWLENLRHGQFRWHSFQESLPGLASSQSLEVLDADGNATWDVVSANAAALEWIQTKSRGTSVIQAATKKVAANVPLHKLLSLDYDNDGVIDLLAATPTGVIVLRGLHEGQFEQVDLLSQPFANTKQFAATDLDRDGDIDVVLVASGKVVIVENQGGNQNHWLDVGLQAQQIKGSQHAPSGRVSAYGLGSLLELKVGMRYQALPVRGQQTHFGLGRAAAADVVRIVWLNGVPQNIIQPAADLFVCEQQVLNTSCPYLYTWNGEEFVFATDLLWAAPLGLQLAEGELAPARDWEYLKIAGNKLAPQNGFYTLQVTEELWEAVYIDEIKLLAVDHPQDVNIFSNEKVGSAELAAHKIHTVTKPRVPVSAKNHRGRDLLPELTKLDGVYAKTFDAKLRQGVVEEHFFELDLGPLDQIQQVTLFLTGWVYPAATSINVALSQGNSVPLPKPPALWVADGRGGWREAQPYMGFPGGKPKTIAIDLSDQLTTGDHRIRIATSMEFYWDQVFFTVNESPVPIKVTQLQLASADLHWRGFSRVIPDPGHGPEQFQYGDLSTVPKWPPMGGSFTRYGDIAELLSMRDDRLAVVGAGDEATLRFTVPASPLPTGWTRDFLIYSVGWDKDCNLQTVLGQTVEPLPFARMSAYPWSESEQPPDTPEYRDYLRTYQTRQQPNTFWQSWRRND